MPWYLCFQVRIVSDINTVVSDNSILQSKWMSDMISDLIINVLVLTTVIL